MFVKSVARNNLERDGSDPHHVAECCIIYIEVLNENSATLTFNGEPYTASRVSPTDVLRNTVRDIKNTTEVDECYRKAAVDLLAKDIAEAQWEISAE